MLFDVADELAETDDGGVLFGCAGMAAVGAGGELDVAVALFQNAQQGECAVYSADGLGENGSALVQQQAEVYSLLLEVGSCANTVEEAKASAELFVKYFAAMIKNP